MSETPEDFARHNARMARVQKARAAVQQRKTLERGLLINRTANTVIRLLPAYIVTVEEIDEALSLLDAAITAAAL